MLSPMSNTSKPRFRPKAKSMKLENVDEKVFGLFNKWLYTQDIEHSDATDPELMDLAKLWTTVGS
jgi:hypothetical protein